jgi:P22 coat protein - gene protein 5
VSTNTLLTPTIIANELLYRYKNVLTFAKGASHPYDGEFDKIGDTYSLREPVRFAAVKSATYSAQDVTEKRTLVQITTQAHTGFEFTSKDLTLTVDRFGDRYLNGAAQALANAFEIDGLTLAYQSTWNTVGTPGTTPSTARVLLDAGAKMDNNSCPFDGRRSALFNPEGQAAMVDALKGLMHDDGSISKQYRSGRMGFALGFDCGVAQNIRTHTVGPLGGTPLVDGASQTGTTLNLKGFTASAALRLKRGDTLTMPGMYAVNPVSGDQLAGLLQLTVQADTNSTAGGLAAVSISPEIITSGPYKTASASPADGAPVTVTGAAGALIPMNLAYHEEAFVYAMKPLEVPAGVHFAKTATDKDSNLSIRMVSQYDIINDKFITRCDILYGWAARRPAWSCRILG